MENYKKVNLILLIILFLNILVAAIKIILGLSIDSNSLLADGFHGVTDSSSNIISIIGIKFASKPADKKHPYGHQKYETIASMFIGLLLFYITIQIVLNAINYTVSDKVYSLNGIYILIGTLVINILISIYEYKLGKKYNSEVLVADSIHTRSDILISFGVIVSIILIRFGVSPIIDPIFSVIIAVIILISCIQILKSTISILVDSKVIDEKKIKEIVYNTNKDIKDVHNVRSRGKNNHIYIDMHI